MFKESLKQYIYLMRFHKPIGIYLLLWPTLWALWLAGEGSPNINIVIIFIVGVVLMRAAGCIINDIADRHFDGHVKRTQERPIAAGKISVKNALILFVILLFCAFLLVLPLNRLTLLLAFFGAGIAGVYPYMKRFTHLPQLGLGIAFAWGVPMAFAAQSDSIALNAWLVFLAAALWPVIYDTMYAMVDREDDIKIGVKSTAILFGKYDCLVLGILQIVFLVLLIVMGLTFSLNEYYFLSLIAVSMLLLYQQILINKRTRDGYFKAFLNNHWVGFFVFLGILLSETL